MKPILGRKDFFDFPELNLRHVPIKIDTGAYSCSMHCEKCYVEGNILYFKLGKHPNYNFPERMYETTKFEQRNVTSSNGDTETRYVVSTNVEIFGEEYETQFSLTSREDMDFPVLVGRLLLKNFLVDSEKKNLSFNKKHL